MKGLNRNQIKYIVIIAMLVDHIAWLFVPTYTLAGELMHFFGRLTGPTMAVFIAEGYRYTKDVKKYLARLGVFALISWPCFSLMEWDAVRPEFGVIYTLFLGLLAIVIWDSDMPFILRLIGAAAMVWLSRWGDWPYMGVLFALTAHIWYDDRSTRWIVHTAICLVFLFLDMSAAMRYHYPWWAELFQAGTLMVAPMLIFLYNGEGGSRHPFHKWFFYVFYPARMLVLWFLKFRLGL